MDLAGHKAFAAMFYAAFPDLRTTRVGRCVCRRFVATVRFRLTGTNTGEFLGNPSTGRGIVVGAIALRTVVDERVVELRAEFDELGLLRQLGALPALASA